MLTHTKFIDTPGIEKMYGGRARVFEVVIATNGYCRVRLPRPYPVAPWCPKPWSRTKPKHMFAERHPMHSARILEEINGGETGYLGKEPDYRHHELKQVVTIDDPDLVKEVREALAPKPAKKPDKGKPVRKP